MPWSSLSDSFTLFLSSSPLGQLAAGAVCICLERFLAGPRMSKAVEFCKEHLSQVQLLFRAGPACEAWKVKPRCQQNDRTQSPLVCLCRNGDLVAWHDTSVTWKHEDLHATPQNPHQKPNNPRRGGAQCWGGGDKRILEDHWGDSLFKLETLSYKE